MAVRTERATFSDVVVDDCPVGIVSQRGTIRGRAPVFIIGSAVSGLLTKRKHVYYTPVERLNGQFLKKSNEKNEEFWDETEKES